MSACIFHSVMNTRIGVVIVAIICVGLAVALFATRKKATNQEAEHAKKIANYSNIVVETSSKLEEQRAVNVQLSSDLSNRNERIADLSGQLAKSEESFKAAQEQLEREAAKVAELESQNQALDKRAFDLSTTITNLNLAIEETQRKLNASEGDKAFLEKELQRLMSEKAELERQFNDLVVLRAQVRKLKEELAISRRLEWIRKGIFGDQKGGELMMQQTSLARTEQPDKTPHYNLNVEVEADGTIRVVPAVTNTPAGSTQ